MATRDAVVPDVGGPLQFMFTVSTPSPSTTVTRERLDRLVDATKNPALDALDALYGDDSWCREIKTHASLEGPTLAFVLLIDPPAVGQRQAAMVDRIQDEFETHWQRALATT